MHVVPPTDHLAALDGLVYDVDKIEVVGRRNDMHVKAPRPIPLRACLVVWVFVNVLGNPVLLEVQVHLAPRWDLEQDCALAIELLEGRQDHRWVTAWLPAAMECSELLAEEDEAATQNEALRYEQRKASEVAEQAAAAAAAAAEE